MEKKLKDMVQFCRNTQPIYGQIYPTDQRMPAEWYIGRPGTPFQFRFFMNEVHVRELLATIPEELRDDQAAIEGLKTLIREEVKAEYEQEIARLTTIIEHMSLEMPDEFNEQDYDEDEISGGSDTALGQTPADDSSDDSKLPAIEQDKPPAPEVFRCLDTGKDFNTLEELQEHQRKLAEKQTTAPGQPAAPKKRPTAQERLDQRRGLTKP